ncbi:MAG: 30S ribosomal protein S8 [Deltaproteobacteria bacterium]|nr:30S ribosomal protein S8 [Deltaproteobacteria bacterium]
MTDPIADMLTRIRNAQAKKHDMVDVPKSRVKKAIAQILKEQGLICDFSEEEGFSSQGKLRIQLKYDANNRPIIKGLKRVSKPGRREYTGYKGIRPMLNGTGLAILSTPKGILTDQAAREQKLGGEILAHIW